MGKGVIFLPIQGLKMFANYTAIILLGFVIMGFLIIGDIKMRQYSYSESVTYEIPAPENLQ